MYRRFFVVFLSCYAELSFAAANDWNCEKNAAGEWSCVTEQPATQSKNQHLPPVIKKMPAEPQVSVEVLAKPKKVTPQTVTPIKPASMPQPEPVVEKKATVVIPESKKSENLPVTPITPAKNELPKTQLAEKIIPAAPTPIAKQDGQADGWTCAPAAENSTWDCHLVGTNPKGETKLVTEEESSFRVLKPAFDAGQERTFKNLQKTFPVDPWQQCFAPPPPQKNISSKKALRDTTALEIESDYSEVFDKEVSRFTGNVQMQRADQHLSADQVNYNTASKMLDTQGNVYYNEDGLSLFSNSATLKLAANKAILRDVLFESTGGPFRGSARVAYKDSEDVSRYSEAAYTSCRPGNQDWVIHTDRLKFNKDSGLGSATNAWLEFKGLPVMYLPYINFPIDNRRTSGFLPPSYGSTARSGFQIGTPFYWNIAPNYDAILKPRYLQRRGVLLGADARYLTEMSRGSLGVEYMPVDKQRNIARFSGTLKNTTTFLPNLVAAADLNYVSDRNYLYELGSALNFADRRYIKSSANLNYNLAGLSFLAQFERYQTIDSTIVSGQRPYQKIPQINLDLNHSF